MTTTNPTATLHKIPLPERRTEVWLAELDVDAEAVERCAAALSAHERARAARFHFERDRRRYTVARGTLRHLLAEGLGRPAASIPIDYSLRGKPYIAGGGPHFNVSHSHERALVAISAARPVGTDIEYLQRKIDVAALAKRFCTPAENELLKKTPADERPRVFMMLWTRKEAIAKAGGEGLALNFSRLEVAPPQVGEDAVRALRIGQRTLHTIAAGDDYVAAVAIDDLP